MNIYTVWTIILVMSVFQIVSASLLIKHTRKCDKKDCVRDQTYAIIVLVVANVATIVFSSLMLNNPPPAGSGVANIMTPVRKLFLSKN